MDPPSFPTAPYRSYPSLAISSTQALATRYWSQPRSFVGPEKPKPGASPDGTLKIEYGPVDNGWHELEDGIQIQFSEKPNNKPAFYRTGDYWLIPARVATGSIIWPKDAAGNSLPQPPRGIKHHYAPLGIVKKTGQGTISIVDCRRKLEPIAKA